MAIVEYKAPGMLQVDENAVSNAVNQMVSNNTNIIDKMQAGLKAQQEYELQKDVANYNKYADQRNFEAQSDRFNKKLNLARQEGDRAWEISTRQLDATEKANDINAKLGWAAYDLNKEVAEAQLKAAAEARRLTNENRELLVTGGRYLNLINTTMKQYGVRDPSVLLSNKPFMNTREGKLFSKAYDFMNSSQGWRSRFLLANTFGDATLTGNNLTSKIAQDLWRGHEAVNQAPSASLYSSTPGAIPFLKLNSSESTEATNMNKDIDTIQLLVDKASEGSL